MQGLMKQYGKAILGIAAALLVFGMLFSIRVGESKGLIQIAYQKVTNEMADVNAASYTDANAVKAAAVRSKPKIVYAYTKTLPGVFVNLNSMFLAEDADGTPVEVEIMDIFDASGDSILYSSENDKKNKNATYDTSNFLFSEIGTYTLYVKAVDLEKKVSYGKYKIPVTSN